MSAAYQRASHAAVVKLSHALAVAPRSLRIWMQSNNVRESFVATIRSNFAFADLLAVAFAAQQCQQLNCYRRHQNERFFNATAPNIDGNEVLQKL